jgi:hypothetical protein
MTMRTATTISALCVLYARVDAAIVATAMTNAVSICTNTLAHIYTLICVRVSQLLMLLLLLFLILLLSLCIP